MYKAVSVAAVLLFIQLAALSEDIIRPATKWQLVYGMKSEKVMIYVDQNSRETAELEHGKVSYVDILVSFNEPTSATVDKKKYMVRAIVQGVVIACGSGLTAPLNDLLFAEPMPTRDSKPVAGIKYPEDVRSTAYKLTKDSAIYQALCPNYI